MKGNKGLDHILHEIKYDKKIWSCGNGEWRNACVQLEKSPIFLLKTCKCYRIPHVQHAQVMSLHVIYTGTQSPAMIPTQCWLGGFFGYKETDILNTKLQLLWGTHSLPSLTQTLKRTDCVWKKSCYISKQCL